MADSTLVPPIPTSKGKKKKKSKANLKDQQLSSTPSTTAEISPPETESPKDEDVQQKQTNGDTPEAVDDDGEDPAPEPEVDDPVTNGTTGDNSTANNGQRSPSPTAAASAATQELDRLQDELSRERKRREELEVQLATQSSTSPATPGDDSDRTKVLEMELAKLEQIRKEEREAAAERIDEVEKEKGKIEEQYNTLRERVTQIRDTLGKRIKDDSAELEYTKQMLEVAETQKRELNDVIDSLEKQVASNAAEFDAKNKKITDLQSQLYTSQQGWITERENLQQKYEYARQNMRDWEVVAMEERAVRESLGERVAELEEQANSKEDMIQRVESDKKRAMDTLAIKQAVAENLEKELSTLKNTSSSEIEVLTGMCTALEKRAQTAEKDLTTIQTGLEKTRTLEHQLREKDLLIGKLKHEAVTLNDHLRKAMRVIKRNNSEDKIDKQLVTNLFLQFQSIERGDTKKYQALQVISSVLDWNDEQKEKAGLLRPGTAQHQDNNNRGGGLLSSFRSPPLSPFHRSPSTPVLSDAYEVTPDRDVWATVLEHEK